MITLPIAKAQLNVTFDTDDDLIQSKIDAAWAWVCAYVGASYTVVAGTDASGDATNVDTSPAPVNEACLQLVAHLYQNREASLVGVTAQTLPLGFLDLLAPYRAYAF